MLDPATLPDDIATLKAMLGASEHRAEKAEARALDLDGLVAHLKRKHPARAAGLA